MLKCPLTGEVNPLSAGKEQGRRMSPCAVAIGISTGRERREKERERRMYAGKQQSKWADVNI